MRNSASPPYKSRLALFVLGRFAIFGAKFPPMASIFTKIINGDIPAYKVAEDETFIAFLDIAPLQIGHTLVVPKLEIDRFFDLPTDVLASMMPFAQRVAKAIQAAYPCDRVGVAVIGLEVPHAHVHLIPINRTSDMNFAKAKKLKLSPEAMQTTADRIRAFLATA